MPRHPIAAATAAFAAFVLVPACSSSSGTTSPSAAGSGSSSGSSSISGSSAPSRPTTTCSDIASLETSDGNLFTAGSWGYIPKALQTLPPSAQACGSTLLGGADAGASTGDAGADNTATQIITDLWDQAIFDFYNPLLKGIGCTLKPMDTSDDPMFPHSLTMFNCSNGAQGEIIASPDFQYIDLSYAGP